ncbi:hypothetical protein ABK040_004256 [Willaertia magna]
MQLTELPLEIIFEIVNYIPNFIEFYKHNILQLNSLNRNSFKRFLLEDLQQFNEHNKDYYKYYKNEEDNNINVNEVIFSKRFKHLLKQCIKKTFISNIFGIIANKNFDKEFKIKTLQQIMLFYNKYNLKISIVILYNFCYNNLHKLSKNFIDFCLQNLRFELVENDYDYKDISYVIKWLIEDYNNDENEYYKKLNQLLNYFFTTNCNKQKLINYLSYFINSRLNTMLVNLEDKSKEFI